ncbi:ATP-binding protein [Massilia sp. CCM 8733]|uniref:ATP-binding protein n=1 Tax=Massilia mucilaginosa TaxID=2609282 RepID=A0ABX0NZ72_9BURK|nr:ATP-binding protein [Massilia mucilaginosa]NHZ92313.1 ATP-binding protein [Massilia mucilaginosa]
MSHTAPTGALPSSGLRMRAASPDYAGGSAPPQPRCVRDTGLELSLIVELVAKAMYSIGKIHLPVLTGKLKLSITVLREALDAMQADHLAEVAGRGDSDLDVHYQLTEGGRLRAAEFLARCRYVGPAPVTLQAYRDLAQRQSGRQAGVGHIGMAEMAAAFADDVLEPDVRDLLGAALQSRRPLLLHGPSGSGKTTLARKLGQLQTGLVAIPHAILVEGHIVQFHDPAVHLPAPPQHGRQNEDRRNPDARWTLCRRPLVQVGAELGYEMLDLRLDHASGVYRAPPHFMANNGILVIDDLGRQRLPTEELLNRFSAPLDSGCDQLTIEGGCKIAVPFDVTVVLATNLAPQILLDESFLRRIGYKILVGPLSEAAYAALFRRQCHQHALACDEDVLYYLITRLHYGSGRPLLASYPSELLGRLHDFAAFAGTSARLSAAAIEQAWHSMALGHGTAAAAPASPMTFSADSGTTLYERII